MSGNKQKGMCKIHNVRFYNLTPRSISYLAYNKSSCKLAVLRQDSSIEIWDMRYAAYMEKTILPTPQSSIEAVGWANDRLFSTGHTGDLTEWNLKTLDEKQSVLLTGNAAWCLDVNKSNDHIAVGTEEGYLNVYSTEDDELTYVKIFDKQEGRILCCKYNHTGDILVTGSLDAVRIWDVKTGHAIHKMSTGRSEAKKETIVWSLAVLKDMTIISGDSRGRIVIWDGKIGAQVDSFTVLKADVLTVAVNDDETTFCCSGIDPLIKMFLLTPVKKENQVSNKWIKFIQRAIHDHDVKALTFNGTKVYSGGIDGYLGVSYSSKSKQSLTKYGPFLQQPCAIVAETSRLLLLKYFNYLEIWRLGTPSDNIQLNEDEQDKAQLLTLEKGIEKVVAVRSHGEASIVCSSISSDGSFFIYSTDSAIRLFRLDTQTEKSAKMSRIKDVPKQFSPCLRILISSNSKLIFLAKRNGKIDVFTLSDESDVDYNDTIDTTKVIKDTISLLTISVCGTYLICAGTCCTIAVWKLLKKKGTWKHLLNLPKYKLSPTAVAIHHNSPKLVAAFSDSKIFEYDLEEMKFTCSTNKKYVSNTSTHAVINIVLDPRNENVIMLHNDTYLYVLEKAEASRQAKVSRTDEEKSDDEISDYKLRLTKHYEHFVYLSWLSINEMVAVGVNPVSLIEQLPPSMRQKKFGAS